MSRAVLWSLALVAAVALAWSFTSRDEAAPPKTPQAKDEDEGGGPTVKLSRAMQQRIDLKTEQPEEKELLPEVVGYGFVLDPAPLAAHDAELVAAEAALAASRAEFDRLTALHRDQQNVSKRSLESSEAQFRADETRVKAARRQIAAAWGNEIAALATAERDALVESLVKGQTVVARVHVPAGEGVTERPKSASVVTLGRDDRPIKTSAISDAPAIDSKSQGRGFLLRLEPKDEPLPPGTAVTAHLHLPGEKIKGVVVPRAAIVRYRGAAWAFVQTGDEKFERREIATTRPTTDGWFVTKNFDEDDKVVVGGAQALLSEELKSTIGGEED